MAGADLTGQRIRFRNLVDGGVNSQTRTTGPMASCPQVAGKTATKELKLGQTILYIGQLPSVTGHWSLVIGHPLGRVLIHYAERRMPFLIHRSRPEGPDFATPPFWRTWNLRSVAKSEVIFRKQLAAERRDGNFATVSEGCCKNHCPGSIILPLGVVLIAFSAVPPSQREKDVRTRIRRAFYAWCTRGQVAWRCRRTSPQNKSVPFQAMPHGRQRFRNRAS